MKVAAEAVSGRHRLRVPGRHALASIGFLILHVAGFAYALATFVTAWSFRLLLQLLLERTVVANLLHLPWIILPSGLVLAGTLAAAEVVRVLRRWRRGQPEPDVTLRLRALGYTALACLLVNAFYLSTPETLSGPFRVRFVVTPHLCAVFAYGGYVLWSLLLPWWRRMLPGRMRRGLDLLCMNFGLVLILSELTLRVVARFWPSPLLITVATTSEIRRDADRLPPGAVRLGFPVNRGSHYDTEFLPRSAGANRIVVDIGDSFSYGAVPHAYHFTTLAERQLPGVDIYNMGYVGLGPSDYLHLLKDEALPLQPDLIIINLFVGNDIGATQSPAGPPRWYDADRYLVAIVWYRLRMMRRAEIADVDQTDRSSTLTGEELLVRFPWLTEPLLEAPSLSIDAFRALEQRNASHLAMPRPGFYTRFFDALAEIERAAEGVRLAFMVIPDEFQVEDPVWEEATQGLSQPPERDLPQRTIVEWLRARGLPVLDLLPLLRAVEPMEDGRRHLYHMRDTHFNARGNEVAGRALAPFVDSLLSTPVVRRPRTPQELPPPGLAPAALPFQLVFGDTGTRAWRRSGWSAVESSGGRSLVWSEGLRSDLWAPLPAHSDIMMDFEVIPFEFRRSPQQRVTIVLNGTVIEEVPLRSGLRHYTVILPRSALREVPNALEFRYAWARAPKEVLRNSGDARMLAVAWYSMRFAARTP